MGETRWVVWTLPSTALAEQLKEHGDLLLTLSLPTDDPETVAMVERAAKNAGMTITRLIVEPT